jgi:hypothetical protein
MSEPIQTVEPIVESPPPAPMPARDPDDDARSRLHRLAAELVRTHNRRLVIEYLQLRRALR